MTTLNPLEIIKQLNEVIENQRKQIDQLKKQLDLLQKLINDLREKLNLNSKNSSLPPSRDFYKLKNENLKKVNLILEANLGTKFTIDPPANPDKIVKCNLSDKCECGGEIKFSDKFSTHTKVELPEVKPIITHYILRPLQNTKKVCH